MKATETLKATVRVQYGAVLCLFFFQRDGYYYAVGEEDKSALTGYIGAGHVHHANLDRIWAASGRQRIVLIEAHGNRLSTT